MLSRTLILAAVVLCIGTFETQPVAAQNLEAGKTPSQLFTATCALCHKSARGLLKTVAPGSLPGFLRQHYTTSQEMASAMSAYVLSNGASDKRIGGEDGLTREGKESRTLQTPAEPRPEAGSKPGRERREQRVREEEPSRPRGELKRTGETAQPSEERTETPKERARRERHKKPAAARGEPEKKPVVAAPKDAAKPEASEPEPKATDTKPESAPETEQSAAPAAKPVEAPKPPTEARPDPVPAVTPAPAAPSKPAETESKPAASPAAAPAQQPDKTDGSPKANSSSEAAPKPADSQKSAEDKLAPASGMPVFDLKSQQTAPASPAPAGSASGQ